jgi:hypothetical protein
MLGHLNNKKRVNEDSATGMQQGWEELEKATNARLRKARRHACACEEKPFTHGIDNNIALRPAYTSFCCV